MPEDSKLLAYARDGHNQAPTNVGEGQRVNEAEGFQGRREECELRLTSHAKSTLASPDAA